MPWLRLLWSPIPRHSDAHASGPRTLAAILLCIWLQVAQDPASHGVKLHLVRSHKRMMPQAFPWQTPFSAMCCMRSRRDAGARTSCSFCHKWVLNEAYAATARLTRG